MSVARMLAITLFTGVRTISGGNSHMPGGLRVGMDSRGLSLSSARPVVKSWRIDGSQAMHT